MAFFKRNKKAPETTPSKPEGTPEKKGASGGGLVLTLRRGLARTRDFLTTDIDAIFSNRPFAEMLELLEERLITADMGVETTMEIVESLSRHASRIKTPDDLRAALTERIMAMMAGKDGAYGAIEPAEMANPHVILVVGVNGVGKTTTIGKLAAHFERRGKRSLIAASDTFRAAAIEQLGIWAERAGADFVKHRDQADPAAVAYDAVEAAISRKRDVVLVDTAGRLHTKVNLMEELKKIRRAIGKKLPAAPHETLLVLDATTGQNAVSQARLFDEAIGVTGIALTKLDGTARGGIVVSIRRSLGIPIRYIGVGESLEDLQQFDPERFAAALFSGETA